jgi:cellulose synthase/poly-beta-1,6-N-acetylglucosamine synthase-like glycosyltransferase
MFTSSTLIDSSVLALSISFVIFAKNWASLLSIGLFYGLRGLCNVIYMMKAPEGLIWESPGIPSATVSYHDTTDFFFSGHVGINLIVAIELYKFGRIYLSYISCIGIVVQIITMLVFRGHYAVDIIAGLIAGHYCNLVAHKYSKYIDVFWNVDDNVGYLFKIFGKEI